MEVFDLICQLSRGFGPSGDESEVRELIRALAAPYASSIQVDTQGNLIVHKAGNGKRVMLCAHMDSIGLVATHVEKEGFLRVGRVGGVTPLDVLNTPVRFQNGVRGVLVKEEKAGTEKLKLDSCYIDIGAAGADAARKLVQVGDIAVFDLPAVRMGERVSAPYLDNRISCGILLRVLETMEDCPNDLYVVFSVQEEVGLRGARTAAWAIAPDCALSIDVTDVEDTPGSDRCGTARLGGGAAVKIMDSSVICHRQVVERLEQLAREQSIPIQWDIMREGGTDAGAIHTTRLGVLTGGVSVPCRYIHTPVETVDLRDVDACVQLIRAFVETAVD